MGEMITGRSMAECIKKRMQVSWDEDFTTGHFYTQSQGALTWVVPASMKSSRWFPWVKLVCLLYICSCYVTNGNYPEPKCSVSSNPAGWTTLNIKGRVVRCFDS